MRYVLSAALLTVFIGCGGSGAEQSTEESDTQNNTSTVSTPTQSGSYTLLTWNDLGMHCVDGKDYSVFSILPPYNNLNAQLIKKEGTSNKHITSGVTLTYQAEAGLDGTINTTSVGKTNFWDYMLDLFGASSAPDTGLTGNQTPSRSPQNMVYDAAHQLWQADGIPILNYNDDGSKNYYPLVKVVAKDSSGKELSSTKVVLPVSDEMDCRKCHASNSVSAAMPTGGWVNNADTLKDFKLNILKLHDQKHAISPTVLSELSAKGYTYGASLHDTAIGGTPILCATCHKSNALGTTGVGTIPPLTKALHSKHANVADPTNGLKLGDTTNRNACYTCHPGSTTQCLRGAMSNVSEIECQSCHGGMAAVGKSAREGWMDEPDCQSCHHDGLRETQAVSDFASGTLKAVLDNRFATTPNTPANGKSLFRFSAGHGDMKCSACHGSTHAIYPSAHPEDNLQSIGAQGHAGTIIDRALQQRV